MRIHFARKAAQCTQDGRGEGLLNSTSFVPIFYSLHIHLRDTLYICVVPCKWNKMEEFIAVNVWNPTWIGKDKVSQKNFNISSLFLTHESNTFNILIIYWRKSDSRIGWMRSSSKSSETTSIVFNFFYFLSISPRCHFNEVYSLTISSVLAISKLCPFTLMRWSFDLYKLRACQNPIQVLASLTLQWQKT